MSEKRPVVIVAGSGLQSIKTSNASLTALDNYSANLTRLVQPIDALHKTKTKVLWALLAPVDPDKLKIDFQMITNAQIDLYNKAAIEVRFFGFVVWHLIGGFEGFVAFFSRIMVERSFGSARNDGR